MRDHEWIEIRRQDGEPDYSGLIRAIIALCVFVALLVIAGA